jgi:membrane-bound lytic murein transglycosylase D
MGRVIGILMALLLLGGCSTTNQISSGSAPLPEETISREKGEERPASPIAGIGKKQHAEPRKTVEPSAIEQPVVGEEDDIASILRADDFQKFDIPIVFNDAVRYYITYFTTEKRKVFTSWLKKARRYVPMITEILKEKGMPEDLVYVAMIESGFNPKAYSPAAACGPWQFIYATGGRYGLRVNSWIDERRDPEKSTVAAAKYLKDLFNQFGCWYLAAAGYNAGERRVERAIEKHNTNDFWELSKYNALPRETREYIPKLIAAAVIAKDPEKFGFGSIIYDSPIRFVELKVPRGTSLAAIAKASSTDVGSVRSFNPEILRGITPPDIKDYAIKLPYPVNRNEFFSNLDAAISSEKKIKGMVEYKVQKKDTLAKILTKFKLNQEDLCLVNNVDNDLKIKAGMVLNIPRYGSPGKTKETVIASKSFREKGQSGEKINLAKEEKSKKTVAREKQVQARAYHVVKKGETLAGISTKYGIDVTSLKSENDLKTDKVFPNMKLKLASHVQKGRQEKSVKYHTVKKGETLSSIASKYGIEVATLKSDNNLKSGKIQSKMKLKIVTEEG